MTFWAQKQTKIVTTLVLRCYFDNRPFFFILETTDRLGMASSVPVLTSNLRPLSSSLAQPATLVISSNPHAAKSFTAKLRRKRENANYSSSPVQVVAATTKEHEDNSTRETWTQLSMSSQNGKSLTKKLGGIVCGVCTTASIVVCGLLPAAFADELPPRPEVSTAATPYARSAEKLNIGLTKGRIQACPLDINPNCVSTSSNNRGYSAPWIIPESSTSNAVKKIETAILSTQKNPAILQVEEISGGGKLDCTYLAAEADGFFGRDVMEFLVKEDVVTYRSMARKVVYLYPFTTPIGDFDGQQKRIKTLEEELGWSIPTFETTFYDSEVGRANDY